jgi:hypothetical protein
MQSLPTPSPEDSPEQEQEHGEYHDDIEHGTPILSSRGLTRLGGSRGHECGQHGLAYSHPLVWQLMLLHKEMIDGCQRLIHQIKIIDSLRHKVLQGDAGKIERTAIALPTIRTLDHRTGDWKTVDAANEGAIRVEATAAVLQKHTGRCGIDEAPWVMLLQTGQQALSRLWCQRGDCLCEVMRLNRKYRELLVTAPIAAGMTGDLRWVALRDGLPKVVNACLQTLVLFISM